MLANSWNVQPGDWVECADGRLSTCSFADGAVIAVEVGFDWYDIKDIVSWTPEH